MLLFQMRLFVTCLEVLTKMLYKIIKEDVLTPKMSLSIQIWGASLIAYEAIDSRIKSLKAMLACKMASRGLKII